MQRLQQNLVMKLVSLACAFGLFLYVRKAESVQRARIPIPLEYVTDPGVVVVEPEEPRRVDLTLRGPAEVVRDIRASQMRAWVNLRGKRSGAPQTVPVQLELPPELRDRTDIVAEFTPPVVKVRLDEQVSRDIAVTPQIDAPPPSGQAIGVPRVSPTSVRVSGLAQRVRRVAQVRAIVTEIGAEGAVDVLARVAAVDSAGNELREIQIQPAVVRVRAPLERKVWTKTGVYVHPNLSPPAPGTLVRNLTVRPLKVSVTGPDAVIGDLWVLETATVLLPPLPGRYERIVKVLAPEGVQRVDPAQVRVTVEIDRGAVAAQPAAGGDGPEPPEERP